MEYFRQKLKLAIQTVTSDLHYTEVIKGSFVTFILRLISFLLLNMISFYIAGWYGAKILGVYTLSFTLLQVFLVIVLFGTDTSLIRLISENQSKNSIRHADQVLSKVITIIIPLSFCFSFVVYYFSNELATGFFSDPTLNNPIKLVAISLPLFAMSRLYSSAFRAKKKVIPSIIYEIVIIRFGHLLLIMIASVLLERTSSVIMLMLLVVLLMNAGFSFCHWKSDLRNWKEKSCSVDSPAKTYREILSLSAPMYLTSSMFLLMNWADTILLGVFDDTEKVGIYHVVLKLSFLTSFAMESVTTILVPKLSEMYYSKQERDLKKIIQFSSFLSFWTSIPLLILLSIFSTPLLSIFGDIFTTGKTALIILCVGQLVSSLTGGVIPLLNMTGHQSKSSKILLVSTFVNILGNLALIPIWGMLGSAIATALSIAVRDIAASVWAHRIFGYRTWYAPSVGVLKKAVDKFPV